MRQSLFHQFRVTPEWRDLKTNKIMQRRLSGCVIKRQEACTMRRSSGRPACDFVRSACGRAFGFASLTSLRRKLAVSTEQLYSLRTVSAVRTAIVHDYEQLYSSRSRRKHSFIHADFQNSIFDLIGISFNVRHRVVSSPLKIGKTVYKIDFHERIKENVVFICYICYTINNGRFSVLYDGYR